EAVVVFGAVLGTVGKGERVDQGAHGVRRLFSRCESRDGKRAYDISINLLTFKRTEIEQLPRQQRSAKSRSTVPIVSRSFRLVRVVVEPVGRRQLPGTCLRKSRRRELAAPRTRHDHNLRTGRTRELRGRVRRPYLHFVDGRHRYERLRAT